MEEEKTLKTEDEKIFHNEDVKGETDEEVDFSNDLFASIATSKDGMALFFNYKNNRT